MSNNTTNFENVKIDFLRDKHIIQIPCDFEKKARRYGSNEFNYLNDILEKYPNYRVVVKPPKKKGSTHIKGLTYDYMEKYITAKNNDLLKEFNIMRGKPENEEDALPEKYEYREIQKWFLEKFPEIKAFYEKRNATKKSA